MPRLFLALGSVLGLLFAILMPPLQVPDERVHFYRIFAISQGTCISPAQQSVPQAIDQLNTLFPARLETHRPVRFEEYGRLIRAGGVNGGEIAFLNQNAAIYSCAPYLASALGVGFARLLSQPAIVLFYCARLANLALYVAAVYLALLLMPFGRPMLFCLALMPMTLHQAASVSADSPTIASAFLLFAYILYLAFDKRISLVSNRRLLVLGLLLLFSTLCKFSPWFVLLVLVIPASRFGGTKRKLMSAGILLGLVLAAPVVWQWLDRANFLVFRAVKMDLGIDVAGNVNFLLHHPVRFLAAVAESFRQIGAVYFTEFVGYFGPVAIPLPRWLVNAWLWLLPAAALASGPRFRTTLTTRMICAGVIAGSVVSIFALLWTFEMHRACLATELGTHPCVAPGIQARYLIPVTPLLILVLANTRFRLKPAVVMVACVAMVLLSSAVSLAAIHRTYYSGGGPVPFRAGAYRYGQWILDIDGNHRFDESVTPVRGTSYFGGLPGDIPVLGDWNGDGRRKLGVYRHGLWLVDWDGDSQFTAADRTYNFGGEAGDIPVTGDWTGNGRTKIGIYRRGLWLLDLNDDGKFESGVDRFLPYGGLPQDIPVVGDWNGKGESEIGIYRNGVWFLDADGNGHFGDTSDLAIPFGGLPGDVPVVGDWNGDRRAKPGIVRDGSQWFLDRDGGHKFPERPNFSFGAKDYLPVVGPWAPMD